MRSVFELRLRSTLLRGARASSEGAPRQPPPGESSGERRLRLLRAILGEPHAEITASDRPAAGARPYLVSDLQGQVGGER
jgi:hypothetical protein